MVFIRPLPLDDMVVAFWFCTGTQALPTAPLVEHTLGPTQNLTRRACRTLTRGRDLRHTTLSHRLSPGRRQQGHCGNVISPRATAVREAIETASGEVKKRLLATKPIQTVLIRQRLGGVGNGSPTAPRPSEIDAVAAEEAVRKQQQTPLNKPGREIQAHLR